MPTYLRAGMIAATAFSIWVLVNVTNEEISALFHLFYIPIILSTWFWGPRSALGVSLLCGLLAGPLMPVDKAFLLNTMNANWIVRTVFFVGIALIFGMLLNSLRSKNQKISEQHQEIRHRKHEIEKLGTEIIEALAQTIEVRDHYTSGHCQRVAQLAAAVAKRMGMSSQEIVFIRWAGIVHDVGKIGIPEEILNKPGRLTEEEYEVMKRHPSLGAKILSLTSYSEHISTGVRHHHERFDGRGYPDGIAGTEISLQAKIIAVCDVWDALTSQRAYRDAFSSDVAASILKEGRGTQFDPDVLDAFLEIIEGGRYADFQEEPMRA